jgi:hypothetical protein
MEFTTSAPLQKQDPQGVGSCTTYLRRYSTAGIANIAQEDDDGNAASQVASVGGDKMRTKDYKAQQAAKQPNYDDDQLPPSLGGPPVTELVTSATTITELGAMLERTKMTDEVDAITAKAIKAKVPVGILSSLLVLAAKRSKQLEVTNG